MSGASALDALCWGLQDAGVGVVTGYPGFHAHELVERCGGTPSVNERTAYAAAWGAAVAGTRAAVALKNVGLNDAADPFINSTALGVNAGMVVVVFDDIEVAGSQCRLDSRPYFDVCPGLWLEPVSARHAYWCARQAARLSERFGVPVVLRVTNALLRSQESVRRAAAPAPPRPFVRDPRRFVAHPVNALARANTVARRQQAIGEFVEHLYPSWQTGPAGSAVLRVGAAGGPAAPGLDDTLWTYPLPERALRRRLADARPINVLELGTPFVCEKVRALAGALRARGRDLATGIDHSGQYRISDRFDALWQAVRAFPGRAVCGDLGSFTMDPARTVDACLCYGASVACTAGFRLARHPGPIFCVTGDAAFLHSGRAALEEGRRRGGRVVVVILDNGGADSTGGQAVPGTVQLPPGLPVVRANHATATAATYRRALRGLLRRPGWSVVHVRVKGEGTR
jgi:indolepyruvate ferredoxin oxidoreductase alpha subunit